MAARLAAASLWGAYLRGLPCVETGAGLPAAALININWRAAEPLCVGGVWCPASTFLEDRIVSNAETQ